jgi:hypothetical protein
MSETYRPGRALRSIVAVLAGMLTVTVLSVGTDAALGFNPPRGGPMTDAHFLLATAYRIVFTIAGGYIAARLAPRSPMRHALAVGIIGLAAGLAGAVMMWNKLGEGGLGPKWYSIAVFTIALPCAWAGGQLRKVQLGPHS